MRFSPSRLRWKYLNRDRAFVGGLALTLGGVLLAVIGGILIANESRYWNDGYIADGHVMQKWHTAVKTPATIASFLAHGEGRKGPRYIVAYEFADATGQRHQGSATINKSVWGQCQAGDKLEIEYVATDPTQSRLFSPGRSGLWTGLALEALGCVLLLVGVTLVKHRVAAVKQLVHLVESGQPILGLIDDVKTVGGKKGTLSVVIHYRYLVPDGVWTPKLHRATSSIVPADPNRWHISKPILILVDPDDPIRHAPDLFDARGDDLEKLQQAKTAVGRPSRVP